MRGARAILVGAVVALVVASTGCLTSIQGTKDWWGNKGGLLVRLGALPPDGVGQALEDFSTLKIGVTTVTAIPVGEVVAYAGVRYNPPLGIDLVKRMEDGEGIPILERSSIPTKTIQEVEVKIMLVDAKDRDGKAVPACPTDKPAESKPCLALPTAGALKLNKASDPPQMQRAKTMVMDFPLAVVYDPGTDEYFVQARFHPDEAPVTFE